MTNKKVFILGPMTGIPDDNWPAFIACEERLRALGFVPVSMRQIVDDELGGNRELPSADYMRHALGWLVSVSQVAVLSGWDTSLNAITELLVAKSLALPLLDETGAPLQIDYMFPMFKTLVQSARA